jgi:hypothetical protein
MGFVSGLGIDTTVPAREESMGSIANSMTITVCQVYARMLPNVWMVLMTIRVKVASRVIVGINVRTSINVS